MLAVLGASAMQSKRRPFDRAGEKTYFLSWFFCVELVTYYYYFSIYVAMPCLYFVELVPSMDAAMLSVLGASVVQWVRQLVFFAVTQYFLFVIGL